MRSLLAGFGIGAVIGLLLAPKRASELRAGLFGNARPSNGNGSSRTTAGTDRPAAPQASGEHEVTLNNATREQLLSVYGIGPVLADRIIENRPYTNNRDAVERGIIPENAFLRLQKELS